MQLKRIFTAVFMVALSKGVAAQSDPVQRGSGQALRFDGTDDYIDLPESGSIPSGNETYAISLWFKASSDHTGGLIGWGNWGTTNEVNALRLRNAGAADEISFRHYWWSNDLDATTNVQYGNHWHHVVAQFDGTDRELWLNGVLIASDQPSGHDAKLSDVNIGVTNSTEYFNGSIDEVKVWNRALTKLEIREYMCQKITGGEPGLSGYWRLDKGSGTTANDSSPNNNDGTLQ